MWERGRQNFMFCLFEKGIGFTVWLRKRHCEDPEGSRFSLYFQYVFAVCTFFYGLLETESLETCWEPDRMNLMSKPIFIVISSLKPDILSHGILTHNGSEVLFSQTHLLISNQMGMIISLVSLIDILYLGCRTTTIWQQNKFPKLLVTSNMHVDFCRSLIAMWKYCSF